MQRKHSFFHYQHASLYYSEYGRGTKIILLFHGFGLTHESFYGIEEQLNEEYTIYNFDIFFHGKSEWGAGEKPISIDFGKEMIGAFLAQKNIDRFSLLGFSIGSKFIWNALVYFPDRIDKVILIAPDGIIINPWYRLSVQSCLSRMIFKQLVTKPGYFNFFIKMINRLGIAPKESIRFAASQLLTPEQRNQVYHTWVVYRKLKVNNRTIIDRLNQYHIPFEIYLGKYDRIIRYSFLKLFLDKIKNKKIEMIEAGHSNILTEMVKKNSLTNS